MITVGDLSLADLQYRLQAGLVDLLVGLLKIM